MKNIERIAAVFINKENMNLEKLEKLLYYYQVWGLVLYEEELLDCKFIGHIKGPKITDFEAIYKSNINVWIEHKKPIEELPDREKRVLDEVWSRYGSLSDDELVNLSKNEWPWIHSRVGYGELAIITQEICEDEMMSWHKIKYAEERVKNGELS